MRRLVGKQQHRTLGLVLLLADKAFPEKLWRMADGSMAGQRQRRLFLLKYEPANQAFHPERRAGARCAAKVKYSRACGPRRSRRKASLTE